MNMKSILGSPIVVRPNPYHYKNPHTLKLGLPMHLSKQGKTILDIYTHENNTVNPQDIYNDQLDVLDRQQPNVRLKIIPVCVTFVSKNHYNEAAIHWDELLEYFQTLVVYSLALPPKYIQHTQLRWGGRVRVIEFDFSVYPNHVMVLNNFSFKPLIMADALQRFKWCVFIDSSIRFTQSIMSVLYNDMITPKKGRQTCFKFITPPADHTIAARTLGKIFEFFPVTHDGIYTRTQQQAGCAILHTQWCKKHFITPLLACGLYEPCITRWNGTHIDTKEHRYDQSVLNVLAHNLFDEQNTVPYKKIPFLSYNVNNYVRVRRRYYQPSHDEKPFF